MITINNTVPLVGQIITLEMDEVVGWDKLPTNQSTCPFVIHYGASAYEGVVDLSNPTELSLMFEQHVILPSGICITLICECEDVTEGCVNNDISSINRNTKVMAVGDDGCPIGHFTVGQIADLVLSEINIPGNICELIGGNVPVGTFTSGDYVLTVNGCAIKAVPSSEVICP